MVTSYPCAVPANALGVFELIGGSWGALPFTVNSVSCKISYSITVDPTIGVFVQAQYYTSTTSATTTIKSGGGGGGGGGGSGSAAPAASGGGGGSSKPVATHVVSGNQNGYIISDITQLNSFNVTLEGQQLNVIENYITPTSAGITINGNSGYDLNLSTNYLVTSTSNYSIYVKLLNVSYLPIEQTISLYIYAIPGSAYNNTNTLDVNFSLSNLNAVNVTPKFFSYAVSSTNVTSNTPMAPNSYVKLAATRLDVNSSTVNTLDLSVAYPCSIPSKKIIPFALDNSKWVAIYPFSANSVSCKLSLAVPKNTTLGIMQLAAAAPPPTTTILVKSVPAGVVTSIPIKSGGKTNYLYIVVGVLLAGTLTSIFYIYFTKLSTHMHGLGHAVATKDHVVPTRRHIFIIYLLIVLGVLVFAVYSFSLLSHYRVIKTPLFNVTYNSTSTVNFTTSVNATSTVNPFNSSTVSTTVPATTTISQSQYRESFQEFGLPFGTTWYVQLGANITNGTVESGIANQNSGYTNYSTGFINFTVPAGIYYYTVKEIPGYDLIDYPLRNQGYANVSSNVENNGWEGEPSAAGWQYALQGTFVPCGSNCNASTQTLSFERFGPIGGDIWSVTVDNDTQTSNSYFINFTEPLGMHSYTISNVSGATAYPQQGLVNLTIGSGTYTVSAFVG